MHALRSSIALALLAVVIVAAGCSDTQETSGSTEQRESTTTSASAAETSSSTAAPAPAGDSGPENFLLPSKNIACFLTSTDARCDIQEYTFQPPPEPADCELDWGPSLFVQAGQKGAHGCISDSIFGGSETPPTLPYGQSARRGTFTCESAEEGVTCKGDDGHGFFLSRERVDLF